MNLLRGRIAFLCASLIACGSAGVVQAADAPVAVRLHATLENVWKYGAFYPAEDQYPNRIMLEDPAQPDETPDHTVHIAGLYGAVIDNRFLPQLASLESRHWTRQPGGNWKMEQWQFRLKLTGEIDRAIHRVRTETERHDNILEQRQEDVALDGAQGKLARTIFNGLLDHWDAWRPAGR